MSRGLGRVSASFAGLYRGEPGFRTTGACVGWAALGGLWWCGLVRIDGGTGGDLLEMVEDVLEMGGWEVWRERWK